MQVTINGKAETLDGEMSVADLLAQRELEPVRVAVEINQDVVPRKTFRETLIRHGDRIEIVTFVGGG
jgi:thiamine biosynthesis protein ThiS